MIPAVARHLPGTVFLAASLAVGCGGTVPEPAPENAILETLRRRPLTNEEVAPLAGFVARGLKGKSPKIAALPAPLRSGKGTVRVSLRAKGREVFAAWRNAADGGTAILEGVRAARRSLGPEGVGDVDTVILDLAHSFEPVDIPSQSERLTNLHRGIRGLELTFSGGARRAAPSEMLAQNLGFTEVLDGFLREADLRRDQLTGYGIVTRFFEADQVLVSLTEPPTATLMTRGNRIVGIEDVTRGAVRGLAEAGAEWLSQNAGAEGRLPLAIAPADGKEIPRKHAAAKWLSAMALGRAASARDDLAERARTSLRKLFAAEYHERAGFGLVERGTARLGVLALAGLAISGHPSRAEFAREESALRRTLEAIWEEDGSFQAAYGSARPGQPDGAEVGAALLLFATWYQESRDPALLERLMRAFRHYRSRFLQERSATLVPWLTRAWSRLWWITRDEEIEDLVFVMNDWLLGFQQWDANPELPDLRGRFYDPDRPEIRAPRSQSTGAFLEGLVAAYRMAAAEGDGRRADLYWRGIRRGTRSLLQLAFLDEVDLYYVPESERGRVRGGLRTNVYDNVIRVEAVHHALSVALDLLEILESPDGPRPAF